jgi:hypothetical protein
MMKRKLASSSGLALCVLIASACGLDTKGSSDEVLAGQGEHPAPPEKARREDRPSSAPAPPATGDGQSIPPGPESPTTPVPERPAVEPLTALSPYHPSGSLTFQRPIDWTISALDPMTVIRYTLDGTAPSAISSSAIGTVTLNGLQNGTRIRWTGGSSTVVHALDVRVDSALDRNTHFIVENVRFDASGTSIVKVAKGARVTGRASASVWNGYDNCPNCIDQVTVGIVSAAACIISTNPQTYPGRNANDVAFEVIAPTTNAVYRLKVGFTQQYRCTPDAIGTKLDAIEIGTIVVE